MKRLILFFVVLLGLSSFGSAQTTSGPVLFPAQTSLANCGWPPATIATFSNAIAACPLNLSGTPGLALAANGGPFLQVFPAAPGAVAVSSVFGRTGAITAAQGDYSYSQLSSPPTTVTCTTFSITSSGGLIASGCTIK